MNYFILYLDLLFVIGLLVEAYILLGRKSYKDKMRIIIICFLGSLFYISFILLCAKSGDINCAMIGNQEGVFSFALLFSVVLAYLARDIIMPIINKRALLVWNLLFLYIYLPRLQSLNLFFYISLVLSLIIIINAFLNITLNTLWKTLFYIWFLVILLYFAMSQFAFSNLAFMVDGTDYKYNLSGLEAFFSGIVFLYITVNLWCVISLTPFLTESRKYKEWRREVTIIMAIKYSESKANFLENLFFMMVLIGILLVNFKYNLVSAWFLTSLVIVVTPFFLGKEQAKTE